MTIQLPIALTEMFTKLFGPKPKFKKGDSVQSINGTDLMVVQWVKIFRKSMIMYSCKWYDSKAKSTRTNIFREEQLKEFDWYHPEQTH